MTQNTQSDQPYRPRITARFFVQSIEENALGYAKVVFMPAYRDGQNAAWAKNTPSGRIELSVSTELLAFTEWQRAMRAKEDIAIDFLALAPVTQ